MTTDSVDWSKALGGLYTTVRGLEQDREDLKLELDKIKTDNIQTIQQADNFSSQTFNQMMLGASQNGVSTIKAWNDALKRGELDPKQYKQNMNSLMENWGTLANSVKSFDAKNAEIQKQIQDGNASKLSVESAEYFARAADLKNLQVFIDPATGTISTGRLDQKTGKVIPDTIDSVKTSADPSNAVFEKVNLDQAVKDVSETFGKYTTENGITTVVDARNNPAFAAKLVDLQNALTSNNRMTASILADNIGGGYTSYYTEQERVDKLNSMIDRENEIRKTQGLPKLSGDDLKAYSKELEEKLIPMKKDSSGVYQPMLTDNQIKKAKEAIANTLFIQLGYSRTTDEPPKAGAANTGSASEDLKFFNLAKAAKENWNSSEGLSALSKDYDFKWDPNKKGRLIVLKPSSDGRGGIQYNEVGSVKSIEELGPYLGITAAQSQNWANSVGAAKTVTTATPAKTPKPVTPKKKFN